MLWTELVIGFIAGVICTCAVFWIVWARVTDDEDE